jgi:hypothetical protein
MSTTTLETEIPHLESVYPEITALNSGNNRRNGKIARLPKETRNMINRMLDDGLPYPVIIDELGEAGEGLNTQNLTNWKQGGYQDYLKVQALIEKIKAQTETAMDILAEVSEVDVRKLHEACTMVAAVQLLTALRDHGDEALSKMVINDPGKYVTLVNAVCRVAESGLRIDKFKRAVRFAAAEPQLEAELVTPASDSTFQPFNDSTASANAGEPALSSEHQAKSS